MPNWIDMQVAEQHRQDMLRAAEEQRHSAKALAARPQPARFYTPALVQLGGWLVAWGSSLQSRYSVIADAPVCSNAGDNISC
jgi:hypothetical protein